MNKETEIHIDTLLNESGLFPQEETNHQSKINFDFSNEIILITGAAGSIGSGLANQLIQCKFKKLILIDKAESPLYELIKELEYEDTSNILFKLIDITDKGSLKHLFDEHKPTIVLHTAAYKHVPLMEDNAFGAVKLNVFGTKLLADLAHESKVNKFIFISTDKAVNPINVMGLTKKIGENYLKNLNSISDTKFLTARFGNILGSNGSVVPLFKRQIEYNRPITITHKSINRYFISRNKACQLILKLANRTNNNGSTYLFNMGKPIKVVDVLERLILKCNKNIDLVKIEFTGLRKGEKIHEELISNNEILTPTDDIDILIVENKVNNNLKTIKFAELLKITPKTTNKEVKSVLESQI